MARTATRTPARSRSRATKKPAEPKFSFIEVRVGKLPGSIVNVALNGGRTVKDALEGANLLADGHEIRVQGKQAELATELKAGDVVLLVRKIKGN